MGVNITTIVYLRVLIMEIGSTVVLMVVEAQGCVSVMNKDPCQEMLPPQELEKYQLKVSGVGREGTI